MRDLKNEELMNVSGGEYCTVTTTSVGGKVEAITVDCDRGGGGAVSGIGGGTSGGSNSNSTPGFSSDGGSSSSSMLVEVQQSQELDDADPDGNGLTFAEEAALAAAVEADLPNSDDISISFDKHGNLVAKAEQGGFIDSDRDGFFDLGVSLNPFTGEISINPFLGERTVQEGNNIFTLPADRFDTPGAFGDFFGLVSTFTPFSNI